MRRQPQIRWRESDLNELRRITKNYNAKISRQRDKLIAEEKRYQAANLPKKASVRELRKSIETRKDFQRELATMQNYIDTGEKFLTSPQKKKSLHATVRDFNTKVDRLRKVAKTAGERAALPEKISSDDLLKTARTPQDLDRLIKDHKQFLKKGSEEIVELPDTQLNVKMTKWQYKLMQEGIEEINEARAKEREAWEKAELKYKGKPVGYTRAQVGMDSEGEFPPMNLYTKWTDYSDLRKKFQLILRERQKGYWDARTELARINYLETMEYAIGNDPVGKILMKQIKGMPLEDFKRTLTESGDLFDLLYRFKEEGDPATRDALLNGIWNEWNPDSDMGTEIDKYIDREMGKL